MNMTITIEWFRIEFQLCIGVTTICIYRKRGTHGPEDQGKKPLASYDLYQIRFSVNGKN